ncbi:MAG: hypothetical protein MGG11_15475 [Trichodesmium sp. MAG_R03]|nr:hypothetical protein [Trichodesmium sp. MAG_R03]
MKYIFKLTIILITFTLVSYDQRYLLNKQFIKPEQATLATRKPGPPLGRSALNRLAEHITIEVVTPIVVFGGGYTAVGSGVIIGTAENMLSSQYNIKSIIGGTYLGILPWVGYRGNFIHLLPCGDL